MTSWASEGSQEAVWRGISLGKVQEACGRFIQWTRMRDDQEKRVIVRKHEAPWKGELEGLLRAPGMDRR